MNPARQLVPTSRPGAVLAALAAILLTAATPAALARPIPPPHTRAAPIPASPAPAPQ
jgi:hypothetical protein